MKNETNKNDEFTNDKLEDLKKNTTDSTDQLMNTDQGLKINDDTNSLKAGNRGGHY